MDGLMRLYRLLSEAGVTLRVPYEIEVGGVCLDSRKVRPGDLFLALRGAQDDGSKYVGDALSKGAAAVLTEGMAFGAEPDEAVIPFPGLRARVGNIFDAWHGHPARELLAVGVTGTNGKSTITKLAASLLKAAGRKVISLGTISYEIDGEAMPSDLTTPGPDAFFKMLRQGVDQGCDALAMEASSHALSQDRIRGVTFARAIFTNLTRDHMDYHKDFEDYFEAKKKLFTEYLQPDGVAILNLDSPYGAQLVRELPCRKLTFTREDVPATRGADVKLADSRMSLSGTELAVAYKGATHRFQSRLIGKINLENLLAVVTLGFSLDLDPAVISRGIADVTVPGRNQVFGLPQGAFAVVDYAHTPDALERVLASLRPLTAGRLACLFGCGGDRDRTKRPIMGSIAVELADKVFLTSDNPRTEDAGAILQEILAGMKDRSRVEVEADRRQAIAEALGSLGAGDCLLVAGKGHEDYQIIGKEKRHFSDQEEILAWMGKRGGAQPQGGRGGA
jgi:UDP-N-acetylmuramoyl-L-alanyl-D-glutamate--2,6-diaminopimelate ligase